MIKTQKYSIALVGCGKMGSAMLRSWLNNNLTSHVDVFEPNALPDDIAASSLVSHYTSFTGDTISTDILIIAVKPQILKDALSETASHISNNTTILSIAAGQTLSNLESIFGNAAIIRTMPNTPAAIGKGVSVSISNNSVSEMQKTMANTLLSTCGVSHWVENERLMDSVTALSGSGPAYIFYLIEVMAKAGEIIGLDAALSMDLARHTVIGSAALAEYEKDTEAVQLRENVTSPNGTTYAALQVLMDGRFQNILNEALTAARDRSKELSS